MKIAIIPSGTTALVNKEIETSVNKLLFDVVFLEANDAAALTDQSMEAAKAAILKVLGTSTATLTKETQGNTITIWNKVPLEKLAEASTNNGGVIRIDVLADRTRLRFTVELSVDSANTLNDSAKMILSIDNKVSASSMDISAMDHPVSANSLLKYEARSLDANVAKDIDTKTTSVLVIPVDSLDRAEVYYNNGRQIIMSQDELKQQMFDSQDPVIAFNGNTFYGYLNHCVLNVENVWKVSLTMTSNQNIYVIKQIPA
jgi:hypothetical protein